MITMIGDINSAGASTYRIASPRGYIGITIGGTWDGAIVYLQKQLKSGTWLSIYSFTQDTMEAVFVPYKGLFRLNTSGSPTIECEAETEDGGQIYTV